MALQAFSIDRFFCYRSKICPGDETSKQMASTEDPRKRKISCSWQELNPDHPVAVIHSSLVHLLISINPLLESVSHCPKVIPLSGAYCKTIAKLYTRFYFVFKMK
jgi:hypothetical protein